MSRELKMISVASATIFLILGCKTAGKSASAGVKSADSSEYQLDYQSEVPGRIITPEEMEIHFARKPYHVVIHHDKQQLAKTGIVFIEKPGDATKMVEFNCTGNIRNYIKCNESGRIQEDKGNQYEFGAAYQQGFPSTWKIGTLWVKKRGTGGENRGQPQDESPFLLPKLDAKFSSNGQGQCPTFNFKPNGTVDGLSRCDLGGYFSGTYSLQGDSVVITRNGGVPETWTLSSDGRRLTGDNGSTFYRD